MNIREIGYFNDKMMWIISREETQKQEGLFTTLSGGRADGYSHICWPIEIEDGKEVKLIIPIPDRCLQAPATAPEPLFAFNENPLLEGKPYILFAANKIFKVTDYAWCAEAFEYSRIAVAVTVIRQQLDLLGLPKQLQNLLAAASGEKAPSRQLIPDDVKLAVWARDGGACVACQAQQDLQFDHIIPFSKGGGHTVENIQLLCQNCNLRKSDNIVF